LKLSRIHDIEPQLPPNRYEHAAPGDLLHLDIKRLVRIQQPSHRVTGDRRDGVKGIGAEFLHVAIDDHSRFAFTAMYPDQTERSSTHFLAEAVAWYGQLGIGIRKILTDNGPCYKAKNFARSCAKLDLKHRHTRPYTPRTNGKAERFIKTAINEWAYAYTFQNSAERTASLPAWTHQYNRHRPHASLNQQPPPSPSTLPKRLRTSSGPRRWEIRTKCTQITGITTEDIRKAKPLAEVLAVATQKFRPANKPCCTWGEDVPVIARTCASLGLVGPFRRPVDLCMVFQGVFVTQE
jgi:hypothetical protein